MTPYINFESCGLARGYCVGVLFTGHSCRPACKRIKARLTLNSFP